MMESEALRGRRPFRRIKDALHDRPEAREAWFAYREHRARDETRRWLRALGIDAVDTPSYNPPRPERW